MSDRISAGTASALPAAADPLLEPAGSGSPSSPRRLGDTNAVPSSSSAHRLCSPLSSLPGVAVETGYVRVWFAADDWADFHVRWLRHNCDLDRHPQTGERIVDSSELPDDLSITHASIAGGSEPALAVTWSSDGRTSRYTLSWLQQHAYARNQERARPPSNPELITRRWGGQSHELAGLVEQALAAIARDGAVVVRRDPKVTSAPEEQTESIIEAFATAGLQVIGTHFGRIEDLRTDNTTNQNTDQLGYTNAPVDAHTDQPFLDHPPRYQLLQGIRRADSGGENLLVDARAAFRYLQQIDADAAAVLLRTQVRFHRKQKAFERTVVSPIVVEPANHQGRFQIRYSYFTMAPQQLPFSEMDAWYRAYDRFARLVRDPRHQYRLMLEPGDFLVYDNHRMLHGRTGFRGPRWVRGIYFDAPTSVG